MAGKAADLICVDMDRIEALPMFDVVSQLVYATARSQVCDVWIAGRCKLRQGELVDIDAAAVKAKAREWGARIAAVRPG